MSPVHGLHEFDDVATGQLETDPDDTGCDVYNTTPLGPLRIQNRCGKPRAERWWIGCVSEHIAPYDVCAAHVAELENDPLITQRGPVCSRCQDKGVTQYAKLVKREKPPEVA